MAGSVTNYAHYPNLYRRKYAVEIQQGTWPNV